MTILLDLTQGVAQFIPAKSPVNFELIQSASL